MQTSFHVHSIWWGRGKVRVDTNVELFDLDTNVRDGYVCHDGLSI